MDEMSEKGKFAVTSPELPVRDKNVVTSTKEFSDAVTLDLTDDQIRRAFEIMLPIRLKWMEKFQRKATSPLFGIEEAMELVEKFEDELKYELATRMDLYVTVDVTPLFEGNPILIDFHGALDTHEIHKYGFDHEKKGWEVKKATAKEEDFLGQKGKKLKPRKTKQ